jgi:5-hydroxyisourate hydrolase
VSQVTTHVLDTALGRPAAGVPVWLFDDAGTVLANETTDADGRIASLGADDLPAGNYRLVFHAAAYFGETPHFFPIVTIDFLIADASHYHVPVLLSPFAYSTYRGS